MSPPEFITSYHPKSYQYYNTKGYTNKRPANKIFPNNKSKRANSLNNAVPGLIPGKGFLYNFLWVFLMCLSILTCSYQIYDRFSFFLSRPVATRVTLIRNSSVKFPSLTLCPGTNSYMPLVATRKQKAKETNLSDFCSVNPTDLLDSTRNISTIWNLMSVEGMLWRVYEASRLKLLRESMGHKGSNEPNLFSIKTGIETVLGTCNTYFFKDLVRFQKDDFALALIFREDLELCSNSSIGMFMLHNDEDIVAYKAASESKQQKPVNSHYYGLSAKRFKILNRVNKPCDAIKVVNECEKNCFEENLKNVSRCKLLSTSSLSDVPWCANGDDARVAYEQLLDLAISFNYLEKCNCSKICDEVLYTDHFKKIEPSKNASLHIYFGDNVIEEIEECYSYRFISFMCDVGGNLGLFLGLSIPAMFGLAESIVTYIAKKCAPLSKFYAPIPRHSTD